jgi:hypothetical protein
MKSPIYGNTLIRSYVNIEGVREMAKSKTAPLNSSLIVHKGAAVPAQAPRMTSAATTSKPREDPIALTVKLDPELYFQLKRLGMRTKPRKSNQALIVEAIKAYLAQTEDQA